MALDSDRLRRPSLSVRHPQSWWDYLFIRTATVIEGLQGNRLARMLSALPSVVFRVLVWGVSPAAEPNFEHRPSWKRIIIVAVGVAIATLAFSFGLNYLFASAAGTLSGPANGRLYYLQDVHNIRIYTMIAPIYAACAGVVIYVYLTSSLFMRSFDERLSAWEAARVALQLIAFISLLLGLDAMVQYRYYNEVITNYDKIVYATAERTKECRRLTYWFAERSNDGILTLNISGMFYFIGGFVRFGIVLAAVFCFVGASASLVRLGLRISEGDEQHEILVVRERLYWFSIIELWMKGLYFILNIHGKVWGDSCLRGNLNIYLAGVAVFVVGWIALTIPRNFVEYRLWRLLLQRAKVNPREGMPDLRNQETLWMYGLASTIFFLVVATLFLLSIDGPVGPETLLRLFRYLGLDWLISLIGRYL